MAFSESVFAGLAPGQSFGQCCISSTMSGRTRRLDDGTAGPPVRQCKDEGVNDAETERDSYAAAGVDIAAGAELVDRIRPAAATTARAGADAALGGFGAVFDLKAAGYRDPLLVASTDGVGTKLKIATALGRHREVGIDLVAMCANDVLVQGAEPLFFLDYFATARLETGVAGEVIAGVSAGCVEAGCALIGGETAEMPGMYAAGDYDLAGFVVGAVERGEMLTGEAVVSGDELIGLASSGVHANGFSLVRKIIEDAGLAYDSPAPFAPDRSLGEALLEPTRIYVKSCLPAIRDGEIKALAHITGGGLLENLPRILPEGRRAAIEAAAWPLPPLFEWLASAGDLTPRELARTFNCGIGMVAVVAAGSGDRIRAKLEDLGQTSWKIGTIEASESTGRGLRIAGGAGHWNSRAAFALEGGGA